MRKALGVALILFGATASANPPLQLFVELTPEGGVLRPPPGTYSGPVKITKSMTVDGQGQVTVDNGGEDTVVSVLADGVTLRGLHLTGSGASHDRVDSAITVTANHAVIEDNQIDDVLFGIHLQHADHNILRRNRISSRADEPSLRGEGIRLWYSHQNVIADNEIEQVRDVVFANSSENRFERNRISHSRIGMELIFSHENIISDNRVSWNDTGMVVIYSDAVKLIGNRLENMRASTSSALAVKESYEVSIEGNEILNCAVGLTANSPTDPENILILNGNRFAYNDVAVYFYGEKGGHIIHDNRFEDNILPVAVSAATSAIGNDWRGNYWDDYEGFDLDHDGVGDVPHSVYLYTDRIWMDRPMAKFFRGSPMLEMLDFGERLAPFSNPPLILSDPEPRMR